MSWVNYLILGALQQAAAIAAAALAYRPDISPLMDDTPPTTKSEDMESTNVMEPDVSQPSSSSDMIESTTSIEPPMDAAASRAHRARMRANMLEQQPPPVQKIKPTPRARQHRTIREGKQGRRNR